MSWNFEHVLGRLTSVKIYKRNWPRASSTVLPLMIIQKGINQKICLCCVNLHLEGEHHRVALIRLHGSHPARGWIVGEEVQGAWYQVKEWSHCNLYRCSKCDDQDGKDVGGHTQLSGFWTPSPPCLHFVQIHGTKFTQPPLLHLHLGNPFPPLCVDVI